MDDLVSILIPVYNREDLVGRAILSAVNQTYKNIEVICVDNCSTDNTWEKILEYSRNDSRIKIFRNEKNIGPVENWFKCLAYSSGVYCKYLWSDDTIDPLFIAKSVNILAASSEVGFVYTKTQIISESGRSFCYSMGQEGRYPVSDFVKATFLSGRTPVSPGCALFRRKDVELNLVRNIENEKKLDFKRYGAGNDLLLFLKTCALYKYFFYIDEAFSTFYAHDGSLSVSNKLDEYYHLAKCSFIEDEKEYKRVRDKYYSYLFMKKEFRYMVNSRQFDFAFVYVLGKGLFAVFSRIKNIVYNTR